MLDNEKYIDKVEKNWEKMDLLWSNNTIRIWKDKKPFFNDPLVMYSLNDDDLILLSEALKKMCLMLFKVLLKIFTLNQGLWRDK